MKFRVVQKSNYINYIVIFVFSIKNNILMKELLHYLSAGSPWLTANRSATVQSYNTTKQVEFMTRP